MIKIKHIFRNKNFKFKNLNELKLNNLFNSLNENLYYNFLSCVARDSDNEGVQLLTVSLAKKHLT